MGGQRTVPSRHRLRVGVKFFLVLVVLVPSLLAVAWVGASAHGRMKAEADRLYADNLLSVQQTAELNARLGEAGWTALQMIPVTVPSVGRSAGRALRPHRS